MPSDEGWFTLLKAKILGLEANTLRIRLAKNDITPVAGTVLADLTEADFSGYAAVTPDFPDPNVSSSVASATAPTATFTRGAGATSNQVYCWYATVVYGGVTKLVEVKRLPFAGKNMAVEGDSVTVTWTLTDRQYVAP